MRIFKIPLLQFTVGASLDEFSGFWIWFGIVGIKVGRQYSNGKPS